jgi:hypothetical protein
MIQDKILHNLPEYIQETHGMSLKEYTDMIAREYIKALRESIEKKKNDPCWKGYAQLGTKKKNDKSVPNCVPTEKKD